jgi:hypothetical protein
MMLFSVPFLLGTSLIGLDTQFIDLGTSLMGQFVSQEGHYLWDTLYMFWNMF